MRHTAIVLFALLLAPAAAPAQPPAAQGPCADDIARFCGGIAPGQGGVMRCLRQHGTELTPACKTAIAKMAHGGGGPRAHMGACHADVQTYCKDVRPGQGRVRACLRQHIDQVSEECKIALMSGRPARGPAATPAATAPAAAATP